MSRPDTPEHVVLDAIRTTLLTEGRVDLPGWGSLTVEAESSRVRHENDEGSDGWTVDPPRNTVVFTSGSGRQSESGTPLQ